MEACGPKAACDDSFPFNLSVFGTGGSFSFRSRCVFRVFGYLTETWRLCLFWFKGERWKKSWVSLYRFFSPVNQDRAATAWRKLWLDTGINKSTLGHVEAIVPTLEPDICLWITSCCYFSSRVAEWWVCTWVCPRKRRQNESVCVFVIKTISCVFFF